MRCRARFGNLRRARVESGVSCLRRLPTHCPAWTPDSSRGVFFAVCTTRSAFGHAARPRPRRTRGLPRRPRPCPLQSRSRCVVGRAARRGVSTRGGFFSFCAPGPSRDRVAFFVLFEGRCGYVNAIAIARSVRYKRGAVTVRKVNAAVIRSLLYRLYRRLCTRIDAQYLPNNTTPVGPRPVEIRYCPIRIRRCTHAQCSKFTSALEERARRRHRRRSLTVNAPLATRKSEPHARLHEHGARHTAQPSGAHNAAAAVTQRSGQRGRLARAGLALLSTRSRRDLAVVSQPPRSRSRSRRDLVVVSQPPRSRAPPRAGLAR